MAAIAAFTQRVVLDEGEALQSIPSFAREIKRPRRTLFRHLMFLHREDEARGDAGWLVRLGKKKWSLNRSWFRALHPQFFGHRFVTRDEHEELVERVDQIAIEVRENKQRTNALASRMRGLREQLDLFADQKSAECRK